MPQFTVPVVRIEKIEKHPNADTLSVTDVEGCPVIFRTGDFQEGDLGIYVPIESLIPEGHEWVKKFCSHLKFKHGVHRVKAIRLRGIFSMGMLVPVAALDFEGIPADPTLGENVGEVLDIRKWEEPDDFNFEQKSTPRKPVTFWDHVKYAFYKLFRIKNRKRKITRPMPVFDLENYRKNKNVLEPGEQVWISEKLHGSNSVFAWHKKRFWVSSHRVLRPTEDNSFWHRAARKYDLKNKLKPFPDLAFYAEIIGPEVQDLGYGLQFGHVNIAVFDIYNIKTGTYLNYNELVETCKLADLPMVPVLYVGSYDPAIADSLKDGPSLIGDHFREGVVVKPVVERLDRRCGRVALKYVGETYLLRKGPATERH